MSKSLIASLASVVLLTLVPFAGSAADTQQKPYVVLDKSLSQLRADFNANAGKVRLLYIVGPTCGICLRGMSDMQEALYSKKGDDARLVTFVLHVPTLGAREAHVGPAAHLIANRYTTNYWEETGIIGRLMQQTMGFDKYTWDFWAIYDARAIWSEDHPMPTPSFWQHQLGGLPRDKKLDASVFAAKVDEYLAQVPISSAAANTGTPNLAGGHIE